MLIEKYCPDIAATGTSCCRTDQLKNLDEKIGTAATLLGRCPNCYQNFLKQICAMTCGNNQADYIHPAKVVNDSATGLLLLCYLLVMNAKARIGFVAVFKYWK